jgi:hypothetical protein
MYFPNVLFRHVSNIEKGENQLRHVPIRPSTWKNSALTERIFMKFNIGVLFLIPVEKIQV